MMPEIAASASPMSSTVLALLGVPLLGIANLCAFAGGRYAVARAAKIAGARFPFNDGPPDAWLARSRWARVGLLASGPAAVYAVAVLCFYPSLLMGGETYRDATVSVVPDRPAALAGIRSGDRVVSIGGAPTERWDEIAPALSPHAGKAVEIVVVRGAEELRLQVVPTDQAKIGVTASEPRRRQVAAGAALGRAVTMPLGILGSVAAGVRWTLSGARGGELGGPVAIVEDVAALTEVAWKAQLLRWLGAWTSYASPVFLLAAFALRPRRRRR